MADKKMYKVGITVKEPWSADISYEVLDITLYAVENGGDGCSYIAIRANQGVTPGTDDTVWVKATQRGQSIYDLAVKYGDFEGTEAEFEAEYEAAVHAAQSAAQSASDIEAQVETNEAARVAAERARSDAETARSSAETARINAENARNDAESLRDTAESDRVRAESGRVTAEASRVEAETFRQGAEQSRRQQFEGLKTDMETAIDNVDAKSAEIAEDIEGYEANEAGRVSAENARATAEAARVSAEQGRATAETERQTAEGNRATAETERASAEGTRTTAEQSRVSAEQGRVSAESGRVTAESERVAAETARETASATAVSNAETATQAANTAAEHAEEAATTIDDKIAGKADESEVSQLSQKSAILSITGNGTSTSVESGQYTIPSGVSRLFIRASFGSTANIPRAMTVLVFYYHDGNSWNLLPGYEFRVRDIGSMPDYFIVELPSNAGYIKYQGNADDGAVVSVEITPDLPGVMPEFARSEIDEANTQDYKDSYCYENMGRHIGVFSIDQKASPWGGLGKTLVTKDDVSVGETLYYSLTISNNTDAVNFYLELLDSNNSRISIYGRTSAVGSATSNYSGTIVVPANFDHLRIRGSASGTIDYLYSDATARKIKDILPSLDVVKDVGLFANNLYFERPASGYFEIDPLFDKNDVLVGESIGYSLDLVTGTNVNAYIELLDANNVRLGIYGKTSVSGSTTHFDGTFTIPENFDHARFRSSGQGTINYVRGRLANINLYNKIVSGDNYLQTQIENVQEDISHISGVENVTQINAVAFGQSPITLLANDDAGATAVDDGLLNDPAILKISDTLYYLYYCAFSKNGSHSDEDQVLCLAYSTDGFTYTRGLPTGVTEIEPGTNIISRGIISIDVKRVNDYDYPYRAVGLIKEGSTTYILALFKSQDAIHFTKIRNLTEGGRDNHPCLIVRGNTLKVYLRAYSPNQYGRSTGIIYCDLEGNIYAPYVSAFDTGTAAEQYYQVAASILDEHREILFPTMYNPTTSQERITCEIVNQGRHDIHALNSASVAMLMGDNKSIYAAAGLLNIGLDLYLVYVVRDTDHEHFDWNTTKSKIQMAKVSFYYG